MRQFARIALLAAGLSSLAVPALADVTNTTFQVTASVSAACSVNANPLAFGAYNPAGGTGVDGTATMALTCTSDTAYTVGLDAGAGAGASVSTRKMSNGAGTLNYTLYRDSGRTTVWGNTVGSDTLTGTGTGGAQTITVYGRIPAGQSASAGTYTDTITVSVNY